MPIKSSLENGLQNTIKLEKELIVGFYKLGSGKPSMTWSQSVDEALCFGWIDSVRRSIDDSSYSIRFTPRKKTSIWSAVNIRKMEELIQNGLMQAAGLEAYNHRKEEKSNIYSFENPEVSLNKQFEHLFKTNSLAWTFFKAQPPGYQKTMIHWLMAAKQEKTRISRLNKLIAASEKHERLYY